MSTTVLGNLRVRLTAETADFRNGLASAKKSLGTFTKDIDRFRNSTLANAASLGGLTLALKSSLDVANRYDNAQRQLAATSKLTGIELGYLESISKNAQGQFKLSAISANAFTIELSKLAGKAGDVGKASDGLEAFLDIGAARGLSADQTLKAVQQSILGIDEGTDKLFSKNPSVLYAEFASSIGTTAGKLTDAQKAQAVLTAAMQDGEKVRGEYGKWLQSSQGQQFLLAQGIEQTQAVLGKALQPALVAVIPLVQQMATAVQMAVMAWQMLGVEAAVAVEEVKAAFGNAKNFFAGMRGAAGLAAKNNGFSLGSWFDVTPADFDAGSLKRIEQMRQAGDEMRAELMRAFSGVGSAGTVFTPPPGTTAGAEGAGKKTAVSFFDGLKSEWEQLRYSVALKSLDLGGTENQRLALEEEHQLRLLDIERERLTARQRAGDLTKEELQVELQRIDASRELAKATRQQMSDANNSIAKKRAEQGNRDALITAVAGLAPSGKQNQGNAIGGAAASVLGDKFNLGGMLGGAMGSLVLPGIGSVIGGAIGSLFGKDKDQQKKQTAALQRIDQNTRQAADMLTLERRMIDTARGLINVPSGFSMPQYAPRGNVSLTVHQQMNVSVPDANSANKVVEIMRREFGGLLQREMAKAGVR